MTTLHTHNRRRRRALAKAQGVNWRWGKPRPFLRSFLDMVTHTREMSMTWKQMAAGIADVERSVVRSKLLFASRDRSADCLPNDL